MIKRDCKIDTDEINEVLESPDIDMDDSAYDKTIERFNSLNKKYEEV